MDPWYWAPILRKRMCREGGDGEVEIGEFVGGREIYKNGGEMFLGS